MSMLSEIRRRARHGVIPVLGLVALAYIAFHVIQGDRGLIAWWHLTTEIENTSAALAAVSAERKALAHRTLLMRPENLDLDLLDERVRAVLLFADPRDVFIATGTDDPATR